MSLPEKPLTRRETYLAKAAGQAVTLPEEDLTREEQYLRAIAEGGGGGGVTPEYVAEAIADAKEDIEAEIPTKTSDLTNDSGYALIDDTTAAQNKTYSSAKVEEKVAGEEITTTATGSDLTLSTSSGNLNALTVYGKSEVVSGNIQSAGEGWATVDLGTLNWGNASEGNNCFYSNLPNTDGYHKSALIARYNSVDTVQQLITINKTYCRTTGAFIVIHDTDYTDATDFKSAVSGVLLAYQLADPTQGNCISIKTDDGSGIDGTMAVFTTGTPLYGVSDTVRDVMQWDGTSGEVVKNCGKVKLSDLNWSLSTRGYFLSDNIDDAKVITGGGRPPLLIPNYTPESFYNIYAHTDQYDKVCAISNGETTNPSRRIYIIDKQYATVADFTQAINALSAVYELATPTTTPLTTTENASIAGLRTFEPQTHAQNNARAMMTIEAYAGTANGKAVAELKNELQITQSGTLTLTVAGWSNNAQTVTYAHDTAKRNVIDVDLASVEEWANCGVLATAETASGITFSCKAVPENALNFRVTSMGV